MEIIDNNVIVLFVFVCRLCIGIEPEYWLLLIRRVVYVRYAVLFVSYDLFGHTIYNHYEGFVFLLRFIVVYCVSYSR